MERTAAEYTTEGTRFEPILQHYPAVFLCMLFLVTAATVCGQSKLNGGQTRILSNIQSDETYTILASDCGKLISFSNPGPVNVNFPEAGTAGLPAGCWMDIQNVNSTAVTLTSANSTIDQTHSVVLTVNQGLRLVSTGTSYLTQRGQGAAGGGEPGSGTVTNTQGNLTIGALVTGNGGSDVKTSPNATLDSAGNISISGTLSTGPACDGCAGAIDLLAGADPGARQAPQSFSWIAPDFIPSSFRWKVPSADAAGALASDGAATPGTLSIVPFSGTGNIAKTTSPTLTTPTLIQPMLTSYTAASLPVGAIGKTVYITDGSTTSDCTTGGGANKVLCVYNGSTWAFPGPVGGGAGGSGLSLPSTLSGTPSGTASALLNIGGTVSSNPYNSNPIWLGFGTGSDHTSDLIRVQDGSGSTMFKVDAAGGVYSAGAPGHNAETPYLSGFGLNQGGYYSTLNYGAVVFQNLGAAKADVQLRAAGGKLILSPSTGIIQNTTIITVADAGMCTADQKGWEAVVSDLLSPAFMGVAVGGGAELGKIICNGSTWKVF
jgi:hypothetical protein